LTGVLVLVNAYKILFSGREDFRDEDVDRTITSAYN
jgi:hypothetical protein